MPKKGSNLRAKDLRIDHAAQMRRVERAGVGDWRHPVDDIEPPQQDDQLTRIMDLAARLTKILSWVSEGREGRTMDMRSWAMLYVMRPDLLRGETMRSYAGSRGVQVSRVHAFVQEFRELFPDVHFTKASRIENREQVSPHPRKASLCPRPLK